MPGEWAAGDWSPGLLALAFVVGYLVGSIPVGVLMARAFGLGDLRKIGSGNIGATNVLRTGSKRAAALTLLLDAAKGAVPVLLFSASEIASQAAGVGAVLGHCLTFWLGFRGGKGVATSLGVVLALQPLAGAAVCATWLVVAFLSRISSVAALVAAASAPFWLLSVGHGEAVAVAAGLAAWVWLRHWENLRRLANGTEPRIGAGGHRRDLTDR
jgi:acyl phosphate:glycerol-3-phosphate acyltransferase